MFSDLHALSLFGVHSVYFACTQIIEIFVLVERFTANLEIQCEPAFVLRHGRWAAGSELLRVSPPCKCSLPQPNRIHRAQQRRRRAAAGGHHAKMATQSRAVFAHRQHAVGNRWCVHVRVRALHRRIIAARQERRLRPEETPVETCGKIRCCSS